MDIIFIVVFCQIRSIRQYSLFSECLDFTNTNTQYNFPEAMDVESIIKEYHSKMVVPDGSRSMDLVSPWFNRIRCLEEGYLLPRCTVAVVGIIGVVWSSYNLTQDTKSGRSYFIDLPTIRTKRFDSFFMMCAAKA